ncbi:haloacid dehalogenase-like protein [Cryptosporidium canis]|nr:haloacid dehalogenase-like protein [Cryptosporidium canis]
MIYILFKVLSLLAIIENVKSQNIILDVDGTNNTESENFGSIDNIINMTDVNFTMLLPSELLFSNNNTLRNLRTRKEQKKYNCSFKGIISDLDGSLAEIGSHSIADSNSIIFGDIISSNIHFFLSTGKSYTGSMKFITNELRNTVFTGFPGVYYNGALVFGPGGINDVLFDTRINPEDALEIIKYIKKFALSNEKSLRFESNKNGNSQYIKISNNEGKDDESADSLRLLNIAIENPSGLFVDGFEGEEMKKYMDQEIGSMVHKGVNLSKFLEPREENIWRRSSKCMAVRYTDQYQTSWKLFQKMPPS